MGAINRRHFLKGTAAGSALMVLPQTLAAKIDEVEESLLFPDFFLLVGVKAKFGQLPHADYDSTFRAGHLELWADTKLVLPAVRFYNSSFEFEWQRPWGGWINLGGTKKFQAFAHEEGVPVVLYGVGENGQPIVVRRRTHERKIRHGVNQMGVEAWEA